MGRLLISREIEIGVAATLAGHAGIEHNHDRLGVGVSWSGKAQEEGRSWAGSASAKETTASAVRV